MLISEVSFPHLVADRDARLAQELERRRILEERMAESAPEQASTPSAPEPAARRPSARWARVAWLGRRTTRAPANTVACC